MPDPATVAGAFPLEAPWVATSGAGKFSSHPLLATRVVRSLWEASPESEASLKSKEPAVALAPIPVAGTAACMLGVSMGLGEV
jgi:hypothetical protein